MLILASLMALAVASLAIDTSSAQELSDTDDDVPSDDKGLPPIMPEDQEVSSDADPQLPAAPNEDSSLPLPPDFVDLPDDHVIDAPDWLDGTLQADDLQGGAGESTIMTGPGDDTVRGGDGNDEIYGGDGNDLIAGEEDGDLIWGEEGDDRVTGSDGDDSLFGGKGDDELQGNEGNDALVAGGGSDQLDGADGDDLLIGENDDSTAYLDGGTGNDILMPRAGDLAQGGTGRDEFALQPSPGALPTIVDFDAGTDYIVLHLPEDIIEDVQIDLAQDEDGSWLITVNDEPVGRLLQDGGISVEDIATTVLRNQTDVERLLEYR